LITGKGTARNSTRTTALLLGGSFLAAHLLFLVFPVVLESWNARVIDQFLTLRNASQRFQPQYDDAIVHADINNSSLQEMGEFYLNRAHFARAVRNLGQLSVSAQLYDFIFAFPQEPNADEALIQAVSAAGNAYFGVAFFLSPDEAAAGSSGGANPAADEYLNSTAWSITAEGNAGARYGSNPLMTFPELAAKSRGLGSLSIDPDPDGVIRHFPLLVRYGKAFYPSLPLRVICDYLAVIPERVFLDPGKSLTLRGARRPGGDAHDIVIPIDERGYFRINFVGPWERLKHYNFSRVYQASGDRDEMDILRQELSGKIVVVSDVSANSRDIGPVPTDSKFPLSGLAANVMNNVLTGSFLRELTALQTFAIDILLLAAVLGFALKLRPLGFSLSVAGLIAAYLALAVGSFLYFQIIFNLVRPLLMLAFAITSTQAYRYIVEEREKNFLSRTFQAYFPPKVVQRIMANPQLIASAGERKELTIMFSDLAGFTRLSSQLSPDRIRTLLNEYFEAMTDIAFEYEGTVDKFMGDGLMVFFGDPEPQPDHALRCVRMAIDMQRRIGELGVQWTQRGETAVQARIGINTGVVVVGNMGSERRLSYTVLGSEVNLAQRFEANAPLGGILISARTNELLDGNFPTRPVKVQVKGYDEMIEAFVVEAGNGSTVGAVYDRTTKYARS
jgi:adenylate cyclase